MKPLLYRTATVQRHSSKYSVILLDMAKNDTSIIGINNTKEMVQQFSTAKEVNALINSSKVDYVISDIGGLRDDYFYISQNMPQKEKSRAYNIYVDAYQAIKANMFSSPSRPKIGQTFNQNRTTGDITFVISELNLATFAVMFSSLYVERTNYRQLIQELKTEAPNRGL